MNLLRVTRDLYGQETLQGVSWDLIPCFVGSAVGRFSSSLRSAWRSWLPG
jgi:hypothetical protein